MPSSTSSSDGDYWVRPMAERVAPRVAWTLVTLIALAVLTLGVGGWEVTMRRAGLTTADIGDGDSAWARERRKVDADPGATVIVGSSRLQFNIDLAEWQRATGTRPIQLAMRGTTPRPMIADFAHDARFHGLLVVGFDPLVFFTPASEAEALVHGARDEPLFRRSGLWLYERLSTIFAYLDRDFTPMSFVERWPVTQRTATGAFNRPWKLSESGKDRQTWLWDRIEYDTPFRERAERVWLRRRPAPKPADIERMIGEVAGQVAAIRARGGRVVFVRSPSDPPLLTREESALPRAQTWDALLTRSRTPGIHFADMPALRALHTTELSHLDRRKAVIFTRLLARMIVPAAPAL